MTSRPGCPSPPRAFSNEAVFDENQSAPRAIFEGRRFLLLDVVTPPRARAPARDAGARDHGADGDGMRASRSRRGVHPRSIRSRVEDRRRRARHGGSRSPTRPRASRIRRLRHHLRRDRPGRSLGVARARRVHQPRPSTSREPAIPGRRATPSAIRAAAPVPRRRLRRRVLHRDRRRRRRRLRRRRA